MAGMYSISSLFCAYTEQVITGTEITESDALIGGRYISIYGMQMIQHIVILLRHALLE